MPTKITLKCGEVYTIYTFKGVEYNEETGIIDFIGNTQPRGRAKRISLYIRQIKKIIYTKPPKKKKDENK